MKPIKYVLTAIAGVALGGCAISNVNEVQDLRTVKAQGGTPFTQALTNEYRAQAIHEADDEFEWSDAAYFARKGLRAAKGEAVAPAEIAAAPAGSYLRYGELEPVIHIPAERVAALSAARGRLTAFLDGGGRERQPVLAAHAQGLFDCWLEEEWETETDIKCAAEFSQLEPQFKPTVAAMAPPAAAVSAKLNQYLVFFDFNRSNLDEGAAKLLQQAANSAKQGSVRAIKLTGHTDAAGGNDYNQALSERRAEVVRAELVKNGVPTNKITSSGVGEAGQLVPTADGVREPQNRRTEITLQ